MESTKNVDAEPTEKSDKEVCAQDTRGEMVNELISDDMIIETEHLSFSSFPPFIQGWIFSNLFTTWTISIRIFLGLRKKCSQKQI